MTRTFACLLICIGFVLLFPLHAQTPQRNIAAIERLIAAKDYNSARKLFNELADEFLNKHTFDSLSSLIPVIGKLTFESGGAEPAMDAMHSWIKKFQQKQIPDTIIVDAYVAAQDYAGRIGVNKQAYELAAETLPLAEKVESKKIGATATTETNLGTFAQRLGNVQLSLQHHRRAISLLEKQKDVDPSKLYKSYNAIASLMWYTSKLDSAAVFFDKALVALSKCPPDDLNKFYRPAIIKNNMSALFSSQGNLSKAMKAQQDAIQHLQQFIASKNDFPQKEDAPAFLFEAIDNLGGFYKEVGNYGKAMELLNYSYEHKQQQTPGQPGIFISEIIMGQLYNSMHEFALAEKLLLSGLEKLEKTEGDYLFWAADAYYSLALVYESTQRIQQAAASFSKSDSLYQASYAGEYDNVYLEFVRNASLFYAKHDQFDKAIATTQKAYNYVVKVQGENTLEAFNQLLNMSEINYLAGKFQQSLSLSNKALNVLAIQVKNSQTPLDSVKNELYKPGAILMLAQSDYAMREKEKEKDSGRAYLRQLSLKLADALKLLERRKLFIDDDNSINAVLEENRDLISFAKKISLELYRLDSNEADLSQLIGYHESALYNRIRSRLDKDRAIRFHNIPTALQKEEEAVRAAIPAALSDTGSNEVLMNRYIDAVSKRTNLLERIKKEYPGYYDMRYGSLFKIIPGLQKLVPAGSTVVRYLFSGDELLALVIDQKKQQLISLGKPSLNSLINPLLSATSEKEVLPLLHQLYNHTWKSIAPSVNTSKVVVIPDGILFNLSFELLTPTELDNFSSLASNSLLNKHSFSYQYSLFMLEKDSSAKQDLKNYIVFAPGFSEQGKTAYRNAVKDSITIDQQYLTLLPQPFTNALAKKMEKQLGGEAFLEQSSTLASFRQHAGDHKIVHVGTHGEFNNERPEQSRIIFAKSDPLDTDSNTLYLSDIYNCNIKTDLAMLTACESGKPGYDDGEGMISFAHAFNYAGSKSILTGLWKIDEQATAIITEYFLENLARKMPSDVALQKAKLKYLGEAKGRMQAPAYWAGLVLLGDTNIIELEKPRRTWVWLTGAMVAILVPIIVRRRRNKKAA